MQIIKKLEVDGNECIVQVDRPNLNIPEKQYPDGSWVADGSPIWDPLKINMDNLWEGKKDIKVVMYDDDKKLEEWTFQGAEMNNGQITYSQVGYQNCLSQPKCSCS